MNYRKLNNTCEYDECDLDSPFEKFTEEEHSKLIVVKKIHQCEESLPTSFIQETEDGDSEFNESQDEKEEGLYFPSQTGSYSSLHIYMKTLSRFPPLNEEEEIALARNIKEQEKECKSLVIKWRGLFKKEYLKNPSTKRIKKITAKLQSLNGTFTLFDHLEKWERERKKINRELKKLTKESKTREEHQEALYKVEAEIAKGIAEKNLSKTTINRIMRDLNKLSHSNKTTKNQQIVKKELGRILREIGNVSKEIKALKN